MRLRMRRISFDTSRQQVSHLTLNRIIFLVVLCFIFVSTAQAQRLSFSFSDPVGDHTGPIDVRNLLVNFDNTTGAYAMVLTATASNPFRGSFRVNVNLYNPDTAPNVSLLFDNVNDFNLPRPTTTLTLTGVNTNLRFWHAGQRVATNTLAFGNPPGAPFSFFRSGILVFPLFAGGADDIAFSPQGFTTIAATGSSQNLPVLPNIVQPRRFIFQNIRSGWIDPPAAFGFKYSMTSPSLFTAILDFPTGFNNLFTVSVGGNIIGTFGPGESVTFPGGGVSEFTITGISPAADTDDPTAFPLKLEFNTPEASLVMEALNILVDIKPGGFSNSINPRSNGVIPVAILTTDTFNADSVDPATIRFGASGTEATPVRSGFEDVDGDGDIDMILHFRTEETGIVCGTISATLTANTLSGEVIGGLDSIKVVGCK